MCNLNIIIKKVGRDHTAQLLMATAHSFVSNKDGDGVYYSDPELLVKGKKKIDLHKYSGYYRNSRFVISHQRYTTHGKSEFNIQPIMNDRFVLAHNGVLYYDNHSREHEKSDSWMFFDDFCTMFAEENDVRKAVMKALAKAQGSYSIFIYDKVEKAGFYFKNSSTEIKIYRLADGSIFITTNKENKLFFDVIKEIHIQAYELYKFTSAGKVRIKRQGEVYSHIPFGNNLASGQTTLGSMRRDFYSETYLSGDDDDDVAEEYIG